MADRRFQVFLGSQAYAVEAEAGKSNLTGITYSLCDWLEPVYCSVVCNGEIGELRLIAAKRPEQLRPEDILPGGSSALAYHTPVQLKDYSTSDEGVVVWDGVYVKPHVRWAGEEETIELVCYNNGDYLLDRIAIHGQKRFGHSAEQAYFTAGPSGGALGVAHTDLILIDSPIRFNPEGAPNACAQPVFINDGIGSGNTVYLFDVPYRNQKNSGGTAIQAKPWQLSWAVSYLLNFYATTWAIDPTSFADGPISIFATYGDPIISNINLEGKSLLEGLKLLLEPHNYVFWIEPQPTSGQLHRIKFASRGDSPYSNTVRLSTRGTNSGSSTANLINADITIDTSSIVNTVRSYGDRISHTTLAHTDSTAAGVLKLVKGWKDSDLVWATNGDSTVNPWDTTFRKNYCQPDLISPSITGTPYGVGRQWLVNLGEMADKDIEDLGTDLKIGIFADRNSIDYRRLERPELENRASAGGILHQEDIQVEMSFDGGTFWDIVEKDWYRVLADSAGIVFVNPKLERLGIHFKNNTAGGSNYWEALHGDKLQIRILCAVKSDERVQAIRSNVGDSVPLATERVYANDGYRRFVFNSAINGTVYWVKYAPHQPTQDDTTALTDITNQQAKYSDRIMNVGQVSVVLDKWNEYHPGMMITAITNRYTFSPAPTILRTIYDFPSQHVLLVLDSRVVKSVIQAKKNVAPDRRQAQMGIGGVQSFQGGNQVPFLPGMESSYKQSLRDGAGGE